MIRTPDITRMLASHTKLRAWWSLQTNVGIMPAGRDVKDEGSNNVVHRDRDTPGTNSLETTRLGYTGRNGHRLREFRRRP